MSHSIWVLTILSGIRSLFAQAPVIMRLEINQWSKKKEKNVAKLTFLFISFPLKMNAKRSVGEGTHDLCNDSSLLFMDS